MRRYHPKAPLPPTTFTFTYTVWLRLSLAKVYGDADRGQNGDDDPRTERSKAFLQHQRLVIPLQLEQTYGGTVESFAGIRLVLQDLLIRHARVGNVTLLRQRRCVAHLVRASGRAPSSRRQT